MWLGHKSATKGSKSAAVFCRGCLLVRNVAAPNAKGPSPGLAETGAFGAVGTLLRSTDRTTSTYALIRSDRAYVAVRN